MITGSHWYANPLLFCHSPANAEQNDNGWAEFEANKNFPGGLKHTIERIREKYQHIQHIAVWHALVCVPMQS
jgi:hypothetical protein